MRALRLFLLWTVAAVACAAVPPVTAAANEELDPAAFVRVSLPANSPLEMVRLEHGQSRVTRGPKILSMDLSLMLTVRNRAGKAVEGIALVLGYGFGKAQTEGLSAVAGIRVEPGASYAVPARMRAEVELPGVGTRGGSGQLPTSARLGLDAVLFADGTTFGPDQMRSLGTMRINQAESARDRRFFQGLLHSGGLPLLIPVLEKIAARQPGLPQFLAYATPRIVGGQSAERARATAQLADFRVVRFPGAPIEIVSARARVFDGGLVDPFLEIQNVSGGEITDFQVAWVLKDASGIEFLAATISGAGRSQSGAPVRAGEARAWTDRAVLATGPAPSGPILTGRVYLRAVQFASGQVWVPEWPLFEAAGLSRILSNSPETSRLLRVYRDRGSAALTAELRP